MANDPAFLFYPGDYLRDTQCLNEKSQVAYDRIMCEHMRNICVTQKQLDHFTKRLSEEEKTELGMVLTKIRGGFQITWIAESIVRRRAYSESRRNNRSKSNNNISTTYDEHMDNENENVIEDVIKKESTPKKVFVKPSIEEVEKVFLEKGSTTEEANSFFNYYESNGWKVGRNPMKNWNAAISNWLTNQKKYSNGNSKTSGQVTKTGTSQARTDALRDW